MDHMFCQQTEMEMSYISHSLKTFTMQVWALPWLIVLFGAALLSLVGSLAGLPGIELGVRFICEAADSIAILHFKILAVVYLINGLWLLIRPAPVVMLACHLTVSISTHTLQQIVLWSSSIAKVRLLHCRASLPTLWPIQEARMVNPRSRYVAGFSPQLE